MAWSIGGALAQDAPEGGSSEPMEELVVTGERSVSALMNMAGRETLAFYELLNVVLDEPEFRINCELERAPGSRINERVCRQQYVEDALNQAGQANFNQLRQDEEGVFQMDNAAIANPYLRIAQKQRIFEEKLIEAVNTNDQLRASVIRMMALKEEIDSRRRGN